jgi:hypothetical protein
MKRERKGLLREYIQACEKGVVAKVKLGHDMLDSTFDIVLVLGRYIYAH